MKSNCYCPIHLRASEIEVDDGIITITVTDDAITDLECGRIVEVGIFTNFDSTSKCNRVCITDGDTEKDVYLGDQYWRPCELKCRSILVLQNKEDPSLFALKGVKGRGAL